MIIHTYAHKYICSYIHKLIHTYAHTYICSYIPGPKTELDSIESIRNALSEGTNCHVKITNYRKNGELFTNLLTLKPVYDAGKKKKKKKKKQKTIQFNSHCFYYFS